LIEVNFTLLVQLANFLILLVILNSLLFKPVLKVLDERDKFVSESTELQERLGSLTEESDTEYETRILAAKQEAMGIRGEHRSEALAGFRDVVGQAKEAGLAELEKARGALAAEADKSRKELAGEAETLAAGIAEKLLGRSAGGKA
jgi:F-type H+-transporting ATPase subunit b